MRLTRTQLLAGRGGATSALALAYLAEQIDHELALGIGQFRSLATTGVDAA
jgi:hypothetical protein